MEAALEARAPGQRRSDERNDTRTAVRELFQSRGCATLIRPASDETEVRHAATSTALRPEFLEQMAYIRARVLSDAPLKTLYGTSVDGPSLVLFATSLLTAMNTPSVVPSIPTAWESVVTTRCREAHDHAIATLTNALGEARSQLPAGGEWAAAVACALKEAEHVYEGERIADARASERKAALLDECIDQVRTHGEQLMQASKDAAVGAADAALGAARLDDVRLLGGVDGLYDDDDDGSGGGTFADRVSGLISEFSAAMPLGPAAHEGCLPLAKALGDAADRAGDKAALAAMRRVHELQAEVAAASAAASRFEDLSEQLQARLELAETDRDTARTELSESREELAAARSEVSEVGARADVAEAQLEAAKEKLGVEETRRAEEGESWQARLEAAVATAAAQAEAAGERHAAAMADADVKREGVERELAHVTADGERAAADAASTFADLEHAAQEAAEAAAAELASVQTALEAEKDTSVETAVQIARLESQLSAMRDAMPTARLTDLEATLAGAVGRAAGVSVPVAAPGDSTAEPTAAVDAAVDAALSACEGHAAQLKAAAEERDALRGQLAHFHERAALLPDRYAVQLFATDVPDPDFVAQLASPPHIGPEELAGTAADLAEGHLGNIAAVASIGLSKMTPQLAGLWSSYFGDGGDEPSPDGEATPPATPQPATATVPAPAAAPVAAAAAPPAQEPPTPKPTTPLPETPVPAGLAADLPPPPSSLPPPPSATVDDDAE